MKYGAPRIGGRLPGGNGMKLGITSVVGAAILGSSWGLAWTSLAAVQAPLDNRPWPSARVSSAPKGAPEMPARDTILREINDPNTGARWLLVRGSDQPGAPGRLIMAAIPAGSSVRPAELTPAVTLPVIHTGDRLIVEENTALIQARLEASALGPAAVGSPLKVRLLLGGAVVRAVALGPGRASFAMAAGRRP